MIQIQSLKISSDGYTEKNNNRTNILLMQFWNNLVIDTRINLPIYRTIGDKTIPYGINKNDINNSTKVVTKRSLNEVESHVMWKRFRRFKEAFLLFYCIYVV